MKVTIDCQCIDPFLTHVSDSVMRAVGSLPLQIQMTVSSVSINGNRFSGKGVVVDIHLSGVYTSILGKEKTWGADGSSYIHETSEMNMGDTTGIVRKMILELITDHAEWLTDQVISLKKLILAAKM